MFNSNVLWILAAFVVYMGVMIAIGAKYMKSTKEFRRLFSWRKRLKRLGGSN